MSAALACLLAFAVGADAIRTKGAAIVDQASGKDKCSAKDEWTWHGKNSCYRSWHNSGAGRCNWIEGACVPNCADTLNQKEDLCESSFCVWSAEDSKCAFAKEKLVARQRFCEKQTELSQNQRKFCTGLSLSPSAPLYAMEQPIELSKFMGCWYVHANIPTFVDKGSVNNIEYYSWDNAKQRIDVTFQYDKPAGKPTLSYQHAYIKNEINTQWAIHPKVGVYLPLNLPYIVVYSAEDYSSTIIGYPDRSYLWIMMRSRKPDPAQVDHLIQKAVDLGYDRNLILKVPFDEGAESPDCKA